MNIKDIVDALPRSGCLRVPSGRTPFHHCLNTAWHKGKLRCYWKVAAEPWKTLGFWASGGEDFNPEPETRLDRSELLCNKVLLKCKRDREGFWQRQQKGAERVPPCSSSAVCYIAASNLLIKERKRLKTQRMAPGPSPTGCILRWSCHQVSYSEPQNDWHESWRKADYHTDI